MTKRKMLNKYIMLFMIALMLSMNVVKVEAYTQGDITWVEGDDEIYKDNIMLIDKDGKLYWFENNIKQGTYKDPKGVRGYDSASKKDLIRGREIYNPNGNGWHWLDAVYGGATAINKEVWMPYIYQDEDEWTDKQIKEVSLLSIKEKTYATGYGGKIEYDSYKYNTVDMSKQVYNAIKNKTGKWVRYNGNGKMYKGWYAVIGQEEKIYPDQKGNIYFYDHQTGLMAKGETTIDGVTYYFNETTGVLERKVSDPNTPVEINDIIQRNDKIVERDEPLYTTVTNVEYICRHCGDSFTEMHNDSRNEIKRKRLEIQKRCEEKGHQFSYVNELGEGNYINHSIYTFNLNEPRKYDLNLKQIYLIKIYADKNNAKAEIIDGYECSKPYKLSDNEYIYLRDVEIAKKRCN